ncbi:H-NS histone family protein [Frigidibacter sp. ROC022]|uniref:H-NS histone family protein n=1 Tax=Frigidibacter sp. ROC022 TaxID=2971796 RepID=UPI00215AAAE9|nr:H-NS histone family protein [Frigidibacter sp. ROC022]MCR8725936.1 H-NS histone family protein [Frigidibacter sp. ROC022]
MKIDLDKMSDTELKELRAQVDKAISTLASRRRAEARKAAEEAASKHGFSLSDLLSGKADKTKGVPKYRNPADPSQTWSGRGRQPGWIKAGLAAGKSLSDFAI